MVLTPGISRVLLIGLGYVLPSYKCYKTVEQGDNAAIRAWAIYWLVLAMFTTLERFFDIFVFWLPMYYETKVGFIIWLWHPSTQGAQYLYTRVVSKLLKENEQNIDHALHEGQTAVVGTVSTYSSRALDYVKDRAHVLVQVLQQFNQRQLERAQSAQSQSQRAWSNKSD